MDDPFQCAINNTLSVPTIQCQIKDNIPFFTGLEPNFRLVTKNLSFFVFLESIFGFSEISTKTTTIDNFTFRKMGSFLENNTNTYQYPEVTGNYQIKEGVMSVEFPHAYQYETNLRK